LASIRQSGNPANYPLPENTSGYTGEEEYVVFIKRNSKCIFVIKSSLSKGSFFLGKRSAEFFSEFDLKPVA